MARLVGMAVVTTPCKKRIIIRARAGVHDDDDDDDGEEDGVIERRRRRLQNASLRASRKISETADSCRHAPLPMRFEFSGLYRVRPKKWIPKVFRCFFSNRLGFQYEILQLNL